MDVKKPMQTINSIKLFNWLSYAKSGFEGCVIAQVLESIELDSMESVSYRDLEEIFQMSFSNISKKVRGFMRYHYSQTGTKMCLNEKFMGVYSKIDEITQEEPNEKKDRAKLAKLGCFVWLDSPEEVAKAISEPNFYIGSLNVGIPEFKFGLEWILEAKSKLRAFNQKIADILTLYLDGELEVI
jgi:hypothetical protein